MRDQIQMRADLEAELMSKIAKVEEQTKELEELKEQNVALYLRNQELEESSEKFK